MNNSNPTKIADIIDDFVTKTNDKVLNRTYKRGIVALARGGVADVYIEGNEIPTPGIICLGSYLPAEGDKVLILSIGDTGTNLVVMGALGTDTDSKQNLPQSIVIFMPNNQAVYPAGWHGGALHATKDQNGIINGNVWGRGDMVEIQKSAWYQVSMKTRVADGGASAVGLRARILASRSNYTEVGQIGGSANQSTGSIGAVTQWSNFGYVKKGQVIYFEVYNGGQWRVDGLSSLPDGDRVFATQFSVIEMR